MNLFAVLRPSPMIPEKYIKKCQKFFLTAHLFFVQLTLDALENRELAEWLAPIFKRLDGQMVAYSNTFGILCDILQLRYRIDGELPPPPPADEVRSCIKSWLEKELKCNNIFADHEYLKKREERKKAGEGEEIRESGLAR
jgi:hypothetical protein